MALTIISGRSGTGKTTRCFELIKEALISNAQIGSNIYDNCNVKISDKNLILLVPEQFTLEMEDAFLKKTKLNGMINVQILSFKRLAYNIFSEVGGITKIPLNDTGKSMILRKVINKHKNNLKAYKKTCGKQGFVKKLSEMFGDFKKYSLTDSNLAQILETTDEGSILRNKIEDLALIYSEFNNYFSSNYINRDEELTLVVPKISDSVMLDGAEIWIDGFDNFSPQQYEIMEQLIKKCDNVTVCLNLDGLSVDHKNEKTKEIYSGDPFYITKTTAQKLISICLKNSIEVREEVLSYELTGISRYDQSKAIFELEKNYFLYPCEKYAKEQSDVVIFASPNRYDEIKRVAREIIKLVLKKDYTWRDCAVVTGDTEVYQNIVAAIFTEFNIPFFIDKKIEIKQHPLIKLIEASLEIMVSNFSYQSVFKYLRTNLTGIDNADIDLIENYVLQYGIRGSKWTQKDEWNYCYNLSFGSNDNELKNQVRINEIKEEIAEPLNNFSAALKKSSNVREMCTAVYELVTNLDVYNKIKAWAVDDEINGRQEEYRINSGIWNIFVQILDEMVEILGDQEITLEEYTNMLEAGFDDTEMGIIPPSIDQVLVGDLERSRSHSIKALFMIGVNDGILPSTIEDNGFITEEEKEKIKTSGFDFLMDLKTKAYLQQFLIYTTITRPSNYLHLSYSLSDEEGKSLRPSFIINRVKEIFPRLEEVSEVLYRGSIKEDIEHISTMKTTFQNLVFQLRKYADGEEINDIWWDVYSEVKKTSPDKLERVIDAIFYSNLKDHTIDSKLIKRLYGNTALSSVTRIEKYGSCPFSFFVEYGLKASPRKEFSISSPDIGQLFHKIIEEFFKYLKEQGQDFNLVDNAMIDKVVSELIEKYSINFNNKIFDSSNKNSYLLKRLKRILIKTLSKMIEHINMGEFIPADFEVEFGNLGKGKKPIVIEINNKEKIELKGKIDRIDVLEENDKKYIKIIDYKSGNTEFDLTDIYYGLDIQLVVYLDSILKYYESLSEGNTFAEPAGMFYFHIKDPFVSAKTIEDMNNKLNKEYKMSGLAIEDEKIIKKIDGSLSDGGASDIIPAGLKKDGSFYSYSSVASADNFNVLRSYVKGLIIELCQKILNGEVPIKPYKKGDKVNCSYCDFMGICQFDKHLDGNTYKDLYKISKNDFWELINQKIKGNGGEEGV